MTASTPDHSASGSPPDWEALARHVAGEGDAGERQRMQDWLDAHPEDLAVLDALDRLAEMAPAEVPTDLDVEGALRRTRAVAGLDSNAPLRLGRRSPRSAGVARAPRTRFTVGWQMAAVLALIAVSTAVWKKVSATGATGSGPAAATYTASLGAPDSVTLGDGSMAVLAPGSQLVVAGSYGTASREVRLTGQGWFRAVHDAQRPFVVLAGDAAVRDVGTEFTVHHSSASGVRVQVFEGAVLVRGAAQADSEAVLLHQGDETVVAGGLVEAPTRGTVAADAASWVSGQLRFRDVPLSEVAETVQRWFGLEIRVDEPALARTKVSIDVNRASLGGVAQELALTVGGRVDRRGDTVVVRSGR
ncbi:MAG: FecR domain-containing protein [Gemmatimonadaceae bacterium]|nr:FecR domain-containing protein [Gemmatimonadaceae bacterium]